jgi:hypothetical protein
MKTHLARETKVHLPRGRRWLIALAIGCGAGGGTGCLTAPAGRIDVPPDLMRGQGAEASNGRSRYVVHMTDGDQDWEFQIPEIATAYEVRVPLRGKPGSGGSIAVDQGVMTAADKEIVQQRDYDDRARGDDASAAAAASDPFEDGDGAPRPRSPMRQAAVRTPHSSYLLTLAKVKELYRTRNYEVALVELVALEGQYPNDERILAMKGTLYEKVGRKQLAREAWEAALAINPYNLQVAEALQRLGGK